MKIDSEILFILRTVNEKHKLLNYPYLTHLQPYTDIHYILFGNYAFKSNFTLSYPNKNTSLKLTFEILKSNTNTSFKSNFFKNNSFKRYSFESNFFKN